MSRALLILIIISSIISCSYKTLTTKKVVGYRIVSLTNLTDEPGLEDRFLKVFKEEASLVGLREEKNHEIDIDIGMKDFKLKSLSVINSLVAEYAISTTISFKYVFKDGKSISRAYTTEFIESFLSAQDVNLVEANKERLTEKALRDVARRAVEEMLLFLEKNYGTGETT